MRDVASLASRNASAHIPPPRTLSVRDDEFQAWLRNAEPGARIEYHRGVLNIDRQRISSPFSERRRRDLEAVADRIYLLARQGRLFLVQERRGENDFSYIAVMAKRARPTSRVA